MDTLNILITNDDGICAPGIARLAAAALPYGHVFVCAPDSQCSGMSQRVTISGKLPVRAHDFPVPVEAAWSIGGISTRSAYAMYSGTLAIMLEMISPRRCC